MLLGLALEREGGFPAGLVARHRNLALGTTAAVAVSVATWWWHRSRGASRWPHRGAIAATFVAIGATGHVGGTLTRGEGYLFEHAPAALQRLVGWKPPAAPAAPRDPSAAAEPLVFEDVLLPLLVERCGKCHGPAKVNGLQQRTHAGGGREAH